MQQVLTSTQSKNVHLYILWLPMLRTDDRQSAIERTKEFHDSRISYYWDEERITGSAWQESLGLRTIAWDIYFLYSRGAAWRDKPTKPYFWMHQLRGVASAPFLNQDEFKLKTLRLLRTEQQQNSARSR